MVAEAITDITELTTNTELGQLCDAALVIEDGVIVWVGATLAVPAADIHTSAAGRALLPGWVDSHTHLIFAGDRSPEFTARTRGEKYSAGGIRRTVADTRAASDDLLRKNANRLRDEARNQGTTCLEIKTGYGLDVETEIRLARLAAELTEDVTFLGAHIVPDEMDADSYVDLVCGEMLTAVAEYVRWVDVFCEQGAFDAEQSRTVLTAGKRAGKGLRVHGNQLGIGSGVQLAVEFGAASVDHLNHLSAEDIDALVGSDTVATFLPACDVSTRESFGPARRLLDAGVAVALASNCNPGSSYTTSMAYCVATAVLQMGFTVEEAVRAATLGGAQALNRNSGKKPVGLIEVGARADLHLIDAPSVSYFAYRPGVPLTYKVWENGVQI